ncbi:MAG: DNA helicase PcrA [Bacillota bacterium]
MEKLNAAQLETVRQTEGPVLVLAGAGSGKTRALTHRIAHLVEKGVPPYSILAITFTNKAAQEMRERVERLVGASSLDMWVMTFHAACVRILRSDIQRLGYRASFSIYDTDDQLTLMKNCLKELNWDEKRYPPRAMLAAVSEAKNELIDVEAFRRQARDYMSSRVAEVYDVYQRALRQNNALDFDDLIMLAVQLLTDHPEVLRYYQNRFSYILVDEFQDINAAQYALVSLLAGRHRNLYVVGDDDQSIYRWRGANVRFILDFEEDYPEAKVYKLEQNYRSTGTILEAANAVVGHNYHRKAKRLWTENPEGEKIVHYTVADQSAEADTVVGEILRLRQEEGRAISDCAILYRINAQSRSLEEALLRQGIPYQVIGGLRFYERKEIKDILAYLRVLANADDLVSLARIINTPRRGIGPVTYARLLEEASERQLTPMELLAEGAAALSGKSARAGQQLGVFMVELGRQLAALPVSQVVATILDKSGYVAELREESRGDDPQAQTRLENLQQFMAVAQEFEENSDDKSLEAFLATISLVTDIDDLEEGEDGAILMTLHTAKGLEFPVVFLVGMEEGVFPHQRSLLDEAELEEERRLCYVGMTRARERLYLVSARQRNLFGQTRYNSPARFIGEIPGHLVEEVDLAGQSDQEPAWSQNGCGRPRPAYRPELSGPPRSEHRRERRGEPPGPARGSRPAAAPAGSAPRLVPGDKVRHPTWGTGTVVSISPVTGDSEVTLAFPGLGVKKVLLSFARLEKL